MVYDPDKIHIDNENIYITEVLFNGKITECVFLKQEFAMDEANILYFKACGVEETN